MRIRRFTAPDSKTALAMVKAELGEEAVILANRTVSSKGAGMLHQYGKTYVEVVAAMDYDLYSLPEATVEEPGRAPAAKRGPVETADVAVKKSSLVERRYGVAGSGSADDGSRLFGQASQRRAAVASPAPVAPISVAASPVADKPEIPAKSRPRAEDVNRWRHGLVAKIRCCSLDDNAVADGPRVIALVGATGVGKTTTAAKLAAWAAIRDGRKVALVSMDCYRIGATDQLRTYAKIMRLPCEVALRKKDLGRVLSLYADRDLIIIDTAGKSPYDGRHIDELSDWFSAVPDVEPYLAISATTKKEDLSVVVDGYRAIKPRGLVLTKLDETRAYAGLCQEIVAADLPVFCLCTGQRVPEDFVPASKESVTNLFCEGWQSFSGSIARQRAAMAWTAG